MSYTQTVSANGGAYGDTYNARSSYGPDLAVRLICPDCRDPTPNLIESHSSGDLICGNCGMVLGDRIVDTRSEWRTFAGDDGDDPSRVGATVNPLMDGMEQLDTTIGFRDGNTGVSRELSRAASKITGAKANQNLTAAWIEIDTMGARIGLPRSITDIAKQLYKRVDDEKILRGKSTPAIIACCIFIACRKSHVPRSFKEICTLTRVPKKVIGQCFKIIEQAFNLHSGAGGIGLGGGITGGGGAGANGVDGLTPGGALPPGTASAGTAAEDLLTRFCSHLGLNPYAEMVAREVIQGAREHSISQGRSPVSIAGGAILFAVQLLGVDKSVKEISAVAGVSENTIKLVYRAFYHSRDVLVKDEWTREGKADVTRLEIPTRQDREAERTSKNGSRATTPVPNGHAKAPSSTAGSSTDGRR